MGEIEQLVRRAKKRDPDAFTELMQLHEKDMYRTASAILPQDADIADAIQETILTVWEKIDTLQKNRYFKTWMIRILINKCKDILRSGRRMICVEELPEQAAKDTVEAEANLECDRCAGNNGTDPVCKSKRNKKTKCKDQRWDRSKTSGKA